MHGGLEEDTNTTCILGDGLVERDFAVGVECLVEAAEDFGSFYTFDSEGGAVVEDIVHHGLPRLGAVDGYSSCAGGAAFYREGCLLTCDEIVNGEIKAIDLLKDIGGAGFDAVVIIKICTDDCEITAEGDGLAEVVELPAIGG